MYIITSCLVLCVYGVIAGYAGQNSGNEIDGGSAVSGGSGGAAGAFGYAGSYAGAGAPPNFPIPPGPQFDFGVLSGYFQALQNYHQEILKALQQQAEAAAHNAGAGSSVGSIPGGASFGGGSGTGYAGGFGGSYGVPSGGGFSFSGPIPADGGAALASAAIGPGGGHQVASLYPESPGNPNINTRFGASSDGGGGGFKSVFTSSQSSTSNVNGKPQTFRQATTTVNDNGKVTSYTVKDP